MTRHSVLFALSFILLLFSACKKEVTETFPIAPIEADTLILNGLSGTETGTAAEKGANARNSVFVDLSKGVQTSVTRGSWDLALYCGTEFRVFLNHSTGATAIGLDKNDFTQLTNADTTTLKTANTLVLGSSVNTVDQLTGVFSSDPASSTDYLSNTVIDEISATAADNKIYIINRGIAGAIDVRTWEKVRIVRRSTGYTIQYAGIDQTVIGTPRNVDKDASFNFKYFSFSNGEVTVEPAKKLWDIEWTYSTYKTSTGTPAGTPDFVLINFANGVQAAQVKYATSAEALVGYTQFSATNLTGVTWSSERDVIGTNWRILDETNQSSTVNRDRFYLIKDTEGNIYKLRFNSFISRDGGTRGKPNLDFRLVQASDNL